MPVEATSRTLEAMTEDELATHIVQQTAQITTLQGQIAKHARVIGDVLIEVQRRKLPFQTWIKERTQLGESTAYLYKRIAERWDQVVEFGLENASIERIRQALMEPKKPDEPKPKLNKKVLNFDTDQQEEFERIALELGEGYFKTTSIEETVIQALRFAVERWHA